VWGIPIKLHISLLLFLPYLVSRFNGLIPGLVMEFGLLLSIVLHELGHSLVAIRKGCRVREILLLPIGGAAQMERIPTRPRDEFLMAVAGPCVSVVLGAVGIYSGWRLLSNGWRSTGEMILVLGVINGILAVFNLVPAFPMDGGRVLRSALTPKLGRLRATFIAARIGKILSVMFGLYNVMKPNPNWFMVVIAVFIYIAAGNEYRYVELQERARRRGATWPPPPGPPPDVPTWEDVDDDEHAIISPPPYEQGPPQQADVEEERRNPFFR
jgi:Zn-dependent protease